MSEIHIITGPMFASKTSELVSVVRRAAIAGAKPVILRPETDTRSVSDHVTTHDGVSVPCEVIPVDGRIGFGMVSNDLVKSQLVGIDEAQFFTPEGLEHLVECLGNRTIVIAGLNLDFMGKPFEAVAQFLPLATSISLKSAICTQVVHGRICGDDAYRTQRLGADGMVITHASSAIDVGGADKYEARCLRHFRRSVDVEVVKRSSDSVSTV